MIDPGILWPAVTHATARQLRTVVDSFLECMRDCCCSVCCFRISKQAFIQDVPNPMDLPDGSPSFQDYMGSRNNRFTTPEAAAKNHILPEFVTAAAVYCVLNTNWYFSHTVCISAFIRSGQPFYL